MKKQVRARRPRAWLRRWIVALLGVPLLVSGLGAVPAQAATLDGMLSFGGYHVGAFRSSTGAWVYCLEPGMDVPFSDQQTPQRVESLRGYSTWATDGWGWNGLVSASPASGEQLRQINWLLTERGQTTDPGRAADVQIALWVLRAEPGNQAWMDAKLGYLRENGAAEHVRRGYELAAEARRSATGPSTLDPSSSLRITEGDELGAGVLTYPAHTQRIRLEGATFSDGSTTMVIAEADRGTGGTLQWTAALHDPSWQRFHQVTASGDWAYSDSYWPAAVILHPPTRDGEQMLGAGVAPVNETRSGTFEPVAIRIDSQFAPTITTQVPERFVERRSGVFRDTVTVGAAGTARWPTRDDGTTHLPLVADGVLYGPFLTPQPESAAPPAGAPVAERTRLAIDAGPGSYPVVGTSTAHEAGYYYWVWGISEAEQSSVVRDSQLLARNGVYADRFGVVEEGQVVATALEWETRLDRHEFTLDDREVTDSIRVRLREGGWLRDSDSSRVPAHLRLTLYAEDSEPTPRADVPMNARMLDSVVVTVTQADEWITAEPFTVPFDERGWVSVQACLFRDDQDEALRDLLLEGCDLYGLPEESARLRLPKVRTEATPSVEVGEPMRDRAYVTGPVPEGAEIDFTYYLAPEVGSEKYTVDWAPALDDSGAALRWGDEELTQRDAGELCRAQPVAVTGPVPVDGEGTVDSPAVTARTVGTGYWVERLTVPHPETGERVVIHEGECGIDNERTIITEPVEPVLAQTGAGRQVHVAAIGVGACGLGLIGLGLTRVRSRLRHE